MATSPVNSDGVGGLKCGEEMKGIGDIGVFDTKVVNAEDEPDGSADVCPQAWCVR